jgi:hypothetical protein
MRHRAYRSTVLALVVAVGALLSGCAGSGPGDSDPGDASGSPQTSTTASPTGSPTRSSPSATPSPTASPTPAAPAEPASILMGAEATDILDANGDVLVSLRYAEDGDEAVAAVTEVLGEPGNTLHDEGSAHYPPADATIWGGFELWVDRPSEESGADVSTYIPAFHTRAVTAEAIRGVSIAAVDGTVVGDPFEQLASTKPAEQVFRDETFGIDSVALDLPESFPGMVEDSGITRAYGVIGFTDESGLVLTTITAPTYLFSFV